jgi:hypothetical protein
LLNHPVFERLFEGFGAAVEPPCRVFKKRRFVEAVSQRGCRT